jgi:hypothetical protein
LGSDSESSQQGRGSSSGGGGDSGGIGDILGIQPIFLFFYLIIMMIKC